MLDIINDPSARQYIPTVPGEKMAMMVRGTDVEGRYTVVESVTQPGAAAVQHVHDGDELFYVTEGEMTFLVGGKITVAPPHSLISVPAGTIHAWRNRSKSQVRMLIFVTPGGIDEIFERFLDLSKEELDALCARHGTRVVGPAIAE